MLISMPGNPSDSLFRSLKIEKNLAKQGFTGLKLRAYWVHWINLDRPLSSVDQQRLEQLLHYGEGQAFDSQTMQPLLVVAPRAGTLSPWSSKATAAAHRLNLPLNRIERGKVFDIVEDKAQLTQQPAQRQALIEALQKIVFDPLMHSILSDWAAPEPLFSHSDPTPSQTIPILAQGQSALVDANQTLGLALSDDEISYLYDAYCQLERDPVDVELMMFAQANSEHCRHKIFNANWVIDQVEQPDSLFAMIRNTSQKSPAGLLSAYEDNAAVVESCLSGQRWMPAPDSDVYGFVTEAIPMLMKVETHNHPTAIAPFPGAATGVGGEIRDEGATGRGSKPKVGLAGFHVSNLKIPSYEHAWENSIGSPARIASALQIMLDGPIGAAAYNNEFGRPNLCGYFRTFEMPVSADFAFGYHKPVMIAGGLGNIRPDHVQKAPVPIGTRLVVLGPPALLIGLGGGAASSVAGGTGQEALDIASVQRENPESERRCQEVIDRCWQLGADNPILFIHDVGAGGLSNALPELVKDAGVGGEFELRQILMDESGLTPLEIWCNESQERYVLAVAEQHFARFEAICAREICPFAVVGTAVAEKKIEVTDRTFKNSPVNLPQSVLFGKPPKLTLTVTRQQQSLTPLHFPAKNLTDALTRVLKNPTVASKKFLITIGDRSVTGTVARDQMVGPWQEPVADVAVTTVDYVGYQGEAMAMGERSPLALISPAASARMAVTEALTNLVAAPVAQLSDVKLSANWMAAAGDNDQAVALYDAVAAIGQVFCPGLGIAIPVGKDSLSMQIQWDDKQVRSPMTLVISAFAPVTDVRKVWTPLLNRDARTAGALFLIDLGAGKNRLGGSILAQVYEQIGDDCPDVAGDAGISRVKNFWQAMQRLHHEDLIDAYHDRSDGGLLITLLEMAFASRCGLDIQIDALQALSDTVDVFERQLAVLFSEEAGAVVQVKPGQEAAFKAVMSEFGLSGIVHQVARVHQSARIKIAEGDEVLSQKPLSYWLRLWAETSYRLQSLRDNPECALQEFDALLNEKDQGLRPQLTFEVTPPVLQVTGSKPRIAILREQGVNGQMEMAAAFHRAGFEAVDVHMSDLMTGRHKLQSFDGLVACGGFSFGDVLGAGSGWAKNILLSPLAEQFREFFHDSSKFALGICNGCQMLSQLAPLIPGANHWPRFQRNQSEQFEARLSLVQVKESPSIFLKGMAGSRLLIATSHGEGRAVFADKDAAAAAMSSNVCAQYVDNNGKPTTAYPLNPNGSVDGVTGLVNDDGRIMLMMPHPERVFRQVLHSWSPVSDLDDGPWMQMFYNAYSWVQSQKS